MSNTWTPIDVEQLTPSNPRAVLVRREDVDVQTRGSTLIQLIRSGTDVVVLQSSGVDTGSGVVTLGLSPTGVVPGSYNNFTVDENGRITSAWSGAAGSSIGIGGSGTTSAVQNQSAYEQTASFWVSGTARIGGATTVGSLTTGTINAASLTLSTPLPVSSGGVGTTVVPANQFFAGPLAGAPGAPGFRTLQPSDLPFISWENLTLTPKTIGGYGIIDAYTKAESDVLFVNIGTGSTSQWLRGDHVWLSLHTTDIAGLTDWASKPFTDGSTSDVSEGTRLYFTNARALSALNPALPLQVVDNALTHSNADGYMHVPATGNTSLGKVLQASATAGLFGWSHLQPNDIAGLTSWSMHPYIDGTTTDITEGTRLYFTNARARTSISVGTSTNLTYASGTGVLDLSPTPVFDFVTLNNTPNQANQATSKQYVDSAVLNGATWTQFEKISVVSASVYSYGLAHAPIQNTADVSLNGLVLSAGVTEDYTITGATITFNALLTLTVGDVVHVKYKH